MIHIYVEIERDSVDPGEYRRFRLAQETVRHGRFIDRAQIDQNRGFLAAFSAEPLPEGESRVVLELSDDKGRISMCRSALISLEVVAGESGGRGSRAETSSTFQESGDHGYCFQPANVVVSANRSCSRVCRATSKRGTPTPE